MVIVAGILVALGFDEFRDARRDRKLERQYAARLKADLALDTKRFGELEDVGLAGKAAMLLALSEGTVTRSPTQNPRDFMEHLEFSTWGGVAEAQSAAFREMETTGRLGLLQDPGLRTALANYYEYHEFIASRYKDSFGPYLSIVSAAFPGALQYSWLIEASDPASAELEAGLQALRDHPEFAAAVNAELRYAASLLYWYGQLRSRAEGLIRQLDATYAT